MRVLVIDATANNIYLKRLRGSFPLARFQLSYSLIESEPEESFQNLESQEKNETSLNDCVRVAAPQSLGGGCCPVMWWALVRIFCSVMLCDVSCEYFPNFLVYGRD